MTTLLIVPNIFIPSYGPLPEALKPKASKGPTLVHGYHRFYAVPMFPFGIPDER